MCLLLAIIVQNMYNNLYTNSLSVLVEYSNAYLINIKPLSHPVYTYRQFLVLIQCLAYCTRPQSP